MREGKLMAYPGLGTDIELDSWGNLIVGADGDLQLCEDTACLMQGVRHRLLTPLGGLFYDSTYGLDIRLFTHVDSTRLSRWELCEGVREQLRLEPRIRRESAAVEVLSWDDRTVVLGISFAWIDGTTVENMVFYALEGGLPNPIPFSSGGIAEASLVTAETPSGTVDGENATFVLANTPLAGTLGVWLNGALQTPGAGNDYTSTGSSVAFATPPPSGSRVRVAYIIA